LDEAFLENILEEIFGTPFVDLGWSLLKKYSRRDIWNTAHRLSVKPP